MHRCLSDQALLLEKSTPLQVELLGLRVEEGDLLLSVVVLDDCDITRLKLNHVLGVAAIFRPVGSVTIVWVLVVDEVGPAVSARSSVLNDQLTSSSPWHL